MHASKQLSHLSIASREVLCHYGDTASNNGPFTLQLEQLWKKYHRQTFCGLEKPHRGFSYFGRVRYAHWVEPNSASSLSSMHAAANPGARVVK